MRKNSHHEGQEGLMSWFRTILFYQCGVIYMGVRLYCNVIATMLQFFIIYVLGWRETDNKIPVQVALVPLILFLVSTGVSSVIDQIYARIGRKRAFSIGTVMMLVASIGLFFIEENFRWLVYIIALFIGAAQALVLNTGITLISDVIGVRGKQGAFVFGVYSFLDKIATGVILFLLTNSTLFPDEDHFGNTRYEDYYLFLVYRIF